MFEKKEMLTNRKRRYNPIMHKVGVAIITIIVIGILTAFCGRNDLFPQKIASFKNGISIQYDVIRIFHNQTTNVDTVMIRNAKYFSKGANSYTDNTNCEYISKGDRYISREKNTPVVYFSDSLLHPISRITFPIYDIEKVIAIFDTINKTKVREELIQDTNTFIIPVRDIVGSFDTLYLAYSKGLLISIKERTVKKNLIVDDLIKINSVNCIIDNEAHQAFNRMDTLLLDPKIQIEIIEFSKIYNSILRPIK